MRVLILSDLHINSRDSYTSAPWVSNFCNFLKSKYYSDTLVIVLGDIIDNDGRSWEAAFDTADIIFSHIEKELETVPYRIIFVPGNHDYCDGNLNRFDWFCQKHQTLLIDAPSFASQSTIHFLIEDINFILTDSIQNKNYGIPGKLDIEAIRSCLCSDKENILFMHHSVLFEDSYDHTGIINQPEAIAFLQENNIKFVFHGHAHATRHYNVLDECISFGVGSIGVKDPGIDNEKEQFFEIQLHGNNIEAIANWLWRGGTSTYERIIVYPTQYEKFNDSGLIPFVQYNDPDNYIQRYVLPRDKAAGDEIIKQFSFDEKITLFDACIKEQLVLFIADAGLGKTIEMRHLAYLISTNNHYMRPVFLPLNLYNGQSIYDYLYSCAKSYKTLDPSQFILIMDGYDELNNQTDFKRELSKFIIENPGTRICISMRSNFLSSSSSVFSNFSVYQLLELTNKEIQAELIKHGINVQAFLGECNVKGLHRFLENPFYLNHIIEIYLSDGSLPKQPELLNRFFEIRFSKDIEKFEFSISMEDSQYEAERALIRFAYGMQLLDCTSCDEKTYQSILADKDDKEYIKHSSFTINTLNGHSFSHNIFKDYFVAKYISKMEYKDVVKQIAISGTNYLNPSWFNIVGLVLQLNLSKELVNWVNASEPLILTRLEPAYITPELRYSILVNTLTNIIEKNVWFTTEICSEAQLSEFVQSNQAVCLLIEQINNPVHFRSLYFALSVLSHFSALYGMENKVRQTLLNCYQNSDVRPHEKRVAISAISMLGLNTPEITFDLIKRFAENSASYERLGVYEYLQQSGQCNEHVDFLLCGIKYLSYGMQNHHTINGAEHFTLIECLYSICEDSAIEKVIEWFSDKDHMRVDFYDRARLFSHFFDVAVISYNNGYVSLYDTVYKFLLCSMHHYLRHHIPDALRFFSETGTLELAFKRLVCEDSEDRILMIEDAIQFQPNLIDLFTSLYMQEKLKDPQIFRRYTLRHQRDKAIFLKCAESIKVKTGEMLTPEVPIDYVARQRADIQEFFNCLFDICAMRHLLLQLIESYKGCDLTFKQLRDSFAQHDNYPIGTHMLEIALIQSDFKDEHISVFFNLINWECFVINRLCYLFKNEKAHPCISAHQYQMLHDIFHQLETRLNYHTAVSEPRINSYQISSAMYAYIILKDALNFSSPESYYLGLLEIPCSFVTKQSNVKEKYDLIEKYIHPSQITSKIASLVANEKRICVLDDLMYGCKRYRIVSSQDTAVHMCENKEIPVYYRRNALEYIFEVFGAEVILAELVSRVDNPLFETIVDILTKTNNADARLKGELIKRYRSAPSHYMLKKLIELNVPEGLQFYIAESKKKNCIIDYSDGISEVTEAISTIHDIELLPLLLEAVQMLFADSFEDGSFNTLYNSLQRALSACAKSDLNLVLNSIRALRKELSPKKEAVSFCSILEENVIAYNRSILIKKWTVPEVRKILKTID